MKYCTIMLSAFLMTSCQNMPSKNKDTSQKVDTTIGIEKIQYPYTIPEDNVWERNTDNKNGLLALSALKALELNDFDKLRSYLGDSLKLNLDSVSFDGPTDKTIAIYKQSLKEITDIHFKVEDWESVVNQKKTETWVSIWYNQYWKRNGKADSVAVFNDLKIEEGKIVLWNEYCRHFALPKK